MKFPIERPRPDPRRYFGIPRAEPGYTNMICPTENKLMKWEIEPENTLRCQGCGRSISRDEAQGDST